MGDKLGKIVDPLDITGARGAKKSSRQAAKDAVNREIRALGELDPGRIEDFMKLLLPILQGQSAPLMQFALQNVAAGAGRTGARNTGLNQALRAGIPGQFAQSNIAKALETAIRQSRARATVISGTPIIQQDSGNALNRLFDIGAQAFIGGGTGAFGRPNPRG